jgi:hypothetical protein
MRQLMAEVEALCESGGFTEPARPVALEKEEVVGVLDDPGLQALYSIAEKRITEHNAVAMVFHQKIKEHAATSEEFDFESLGKEINALEIGATFANNILAAELRAMVTGMGIYAKGAGLRVGWQIVVLTMVPIYEITFQAGRSPAGAASDDEKSPEEGRIASGAKSREDNKRQWN